MAGKGMTEQILRLPLLVKADSNVDADELARLTVDLRELLLELDIKSAEHVTRGPAPPGTRAGEMVVAGALTVILVRSKELVTKLVETVQWWLSLGPGRSVEIELDGQKLKATRLSPEDQRKLIQFFMDRHTTE